MCIYKALQLPPEQQNINNIVNIGNIQFAPETLSSSEERNLSLKQFYRFYEVLGMKWELVGHAFKAQLHKSFHPTLFY